ncbi:glycoside hydrolase, partial [Mycolicibacterium austroafricanum]|uniref:sialidase family protein n=1 Tax=Mycolicibacterium austroafricanum TaxID=39687 RepID=UPI001CA751F0
MDYAIYDPDITTTMVVNPYDDPSGLTYVSNSSLAYYGGKFWAVMDGTTEGMTEGSPGQQIYLTTSTNGIEWTPAIRPFGDSAYCENPIGGPALQWQPNLVVVGEELWCTWTAADGYVSKLASPMGKWTNFRFEFDGLAAITSQIASGDLTPGRSARASYGGISDWLPFFSQNPIFLADGVLVCPLTIYSRTESNQTPAADSFLRSLKFNALMSTTDGSTWSMTLIDTSAFGDFCAWEPFVVQSRAGHVYVYSRNLNTLAADPDFLLVAESKDGGNTFSSSVSTKLLVPSSRGFARRISASRWVMVHADHPQRSDQTPNQRLSLTGRRNGSLFVSRQGVDDFVPGVNFSGKDTSMNYPQFIAGPDDALYINYTSGVGVDIRRSLRVVRVSPLPRDDLAYVHPRSVNIYADRSPTRPARQSDSAGMYYDFDARSQVLSRISLVASSGVTYTAWLEWDTGGDAIMDSRAAGAETFGQVLHLDGLAIRSLNFRHGFTLKPETPTFVAATVDNSAQTVHLYVGSGGDILMSTRGHFRSVRFTNQPADGDTMNHPGFDAHLLSREGCSHYAEEVRRRVQGPG